MAKNGFLCILLYCVFALTSLVLCQDQSGFVSIDCGIPEDSSVYKDEVTGIKYLSDAKFTDTGVNRNISAQHKTSTLKRQLWNVRSFPEGTRNCYTITPANGKDQMYLIRAWFMYGNYDGEDRIPEFDLYLGVSKWASVTLKDASFILTKELLHNPSSSYVQICLVNTGSGTPFVSAIELRPMTDDIYLTDSRTLELQGRLDCGLEEQGTVRFPDDRFDRIWSPLNSENWEVLSTNTNVDGVDRPVYSVYRPAPKVMRTAITPMNGSDALGFSWNITDPNARIFVYMHFAELKELQANESRKFYIHVNKISQYGPYAPEYLSSETITSRDYKSSKIQIWINQTKSSTLPPLINALEIYISKDLQSLESDQQEIESLKNIKSMFGIKRNWQGDPCQPKAYMWEGLNCSYDDYDPSRIISLNLSSSGLTGEITSYVANLAALQILDLSNNSLTGMVPNFLTQLVFLKVLNLEGNNLSGSVPAKLIEKSISGTLLLSLGQNQNLCQSKSCKKKENFIVPIVISGVGLVVLLSLVAALAIFWGRKSRNRGTTATGKISSVDAYQAKEKSSASSKTGLFSDNLSTNNNSERVSGNGDKYRNERDS